ncbi:type I restriction endonuclease [Brevibacterium yomogidense]|uniref:type I restriction endonuclease n=1 Tax=Brevibacterium yomogidense TaxID=946573 RepID=UPI002FCD385B
MMVVKDQLDLIARKLKNTRSSIATEEATKTTLIMPFIRDVLGFDVFDVEEVIPEFVADVGIKKGEKIDFAIVNDGVVAMLIEAKKVGEPLSLENASQLYRYFNVTSARIAILTNGDEYRFYTDLDEPNRMDERPFLELRLGDIDAALIPEIEKLSKRHFDLDSVLNAAEELKYVSAAKRVFASEFKDLSQDFATLVLNRVYQGRITQRVREDLTPLVSKGFQQFISDQVNNRLKAALGDEVEGQSEDEAVSVAEQQVEIVEDGIETTDEEVQAFRIVQAIAAQDVDPARIGYRDAKSYCPVLLDDNNRQTICRLRFNNLSRLRLGLLDEDRVEAVYDLGRVEDIYKYAAEIREVMRRFL